jgi:hypothetical protein
MILEKTPSFDDFLLYQAEDGEIRIDVCMQGETV